MIIARDENGMPVEAERDASGVSPRGFCPCCGKELKARVGEVRRAHWAHDLGERCDEWWEEESEWRVDWMARLKDYPLLDLQNTLEKGGERHFYDVRDGEARVWVMRRKKLPVEQVEMRERFFHRMLWLVEAKESEYGAFQDIRESLQRKKIAKRTYYWGRNNPRFCSRWMDCTMPVLFDFASASGGEESTLWCVLQKTTGEIFILEFPREDLFERLSCDGRLFKQEIHTILDKLMGLSEVVRNRERQQASGGRLRVPRTGNLPRRESTMPVRLHTGVLVPVKTADVSNLPPPPIVPTVQVSFEARVAELQRLGFNHADALKRASLGV